MKRRARRNHTPAFKAKVALAAVKNDEHWHSWLSSSTFIPIRSHRGRSNLREARPRFLDRRRQRISATGRRHQDAAREDRRADAGERFFRTCARQGGIGERKAMINRDHDLALTKQADAPRHQPGKRLLRAEAGAGGPRADAAHGRTASGVSLRRLADVARPAGCRRKQDRPASYQDVDAAHGNRGDLSPSEHDEAGAGSSHLSVSAARH